MTAVAIPRHDTVSRREARTMTFLIAPALAVMALWLMVPLLWLIYLSFVKGDALTFANYEKIFTEPFYAKSVWLTIKVAAIVTLITAVMGYVLAYAMTLLPRWIVAVALVLVALPFWTSSLVRTYAWLALLQNKGVVNNALIGAGVIDTPIPMMHNLTGTMIGMIHILLPYMIFPIYAGLRRIDGDYVRASLGLGASATYAFWRVYFPLSLPGVLAGVLMVFVLGMGFYVTPALLGGGRSMLISLVIQRDINFNLEWGPASAIATLFVLVVLLLFGIGSRFVSLQRVFQR